MTDEQKRQIAKLRIEGLGYKAIAERLGFSINSVKSYCKMHALEVGEIADSVCENCGKPIYQVPGRRRKRFADGKVSIYSSKIFCGECGGVYGAKVWHSTDKYRRTVYRCNDKFKNHCHTPHFTVEEIQTIFIKAVNKLLEGKDEVIANIRLLQRDVCGKDELVKEQAKYHEDMVALAELTSQCIAENARVAMDQDDYKKRYGDLAGRYDAAKKAYDTVTDEIQHRQARNEQMDAFIAELKEQGMLTEFDERLWCSLVDFITVYGKGDIRVTFRDGTEIRA